MKSAYEYVNNPDHFYHVRPDEIDELVNDLESLQCPNLQIRRFRQFAGRDAYGLTFTAAEGDWRTRRRLFVSRPHAHEPAGVAAITELAKALAGWSDYTARNQDWREWALNNFVLTLLPDANPCGSQRAPVKFWDGSFCDNTQFFLWMFGESGDKPGERFPRVPAWDMREVTPPALLGICYEQLNEHTYLEPNRDIRSTFFRSFIELDKTYGYEVWLDLHQTEFLNSERNTEVLLPACLKMLDESAQDRTISLGNAMIERWKSEGANPTLRPLIPYQNNPAQTSYLLPVWLPFCQRLTCIISEVQNNNPRTPPPVQIRLEIAAVLATMEWMEREFKK